jgi:hypothetical protein
MVDVERALRVCGVCVGKWCGRVGRTCTCVDLRGFLATKVDLHIGHWLTCTRYMRSCIGGTAPCSERKFGRELDRRSVHRELCDTRVDHHAHLMVGTWPGRHAILHNLIRSANLLCCALCLAGVTR